MKLKRSDYNPEPKYVYRLQYSLGNEIYCVRGDEYDDIDFGIGKYGCENAKLFPTINEAKKMLVDILEYAYQNPSIEYIPGSYYNGKKLDVNGKFSVSKVDNPNYGWASKMPIYERESEGKNYTLNLDRKKKSTKSKSKRPLSKKSGEKLQSFYGVKTNVGKKAESMLTSIYREKKTTTKPKRKIVKK